MERECAEGGLHDPLTRANAAGPASPYPHPVARTLSYLANLIDSSIQLRGVGIAVRDFAAAFLDASTTEIVSVSAEPGTLEFQLAALAFAEDLAEHPPAGMIGEDAEEPPHWQVLDLGELSLSIPYQLAAGFPAGTVAPCPLVVSVADGPTHGSFVIAVYARSTEAGHARAYLDALLERGRTRTNPFRGRILETVFDQRFGLSFRVASFEAISRKDVILAGTVWESLDRDVLGFFAALGSLKRAGLARNRGVLLEGPPGTGKTVVCRVLAHELDDVTVVFCDATSVLRSVRQLYRELVHLAPALVVMEDVDLILRDRARDGGTALNDFLLALDGAMSDHEGVVTIATTNDLRAIDAAARRSARFDVVVSVGLPNPAARAAILRRYLANVDHDVDAVAVARVTEGMSGADLRELVGQAVIRANQDGSIPTTSGMVMLAGIGGDDRRVGPYL